MAGAGSATAASGTSAAGSAFSAQLSNAEAARPSAAGAGTSASGSTTPVPLQDAVDAVKATFTATNLSGATTARITLTPASLGGITISLSQTADGLIARVTADHPEAAQALAQGADDLKRSLEQGGMSLLRLDIGNSGGQSLASFTNGGSGGNTGEGTNGGQTSTQTVLDGTEDEGEPATSASTPSAGGTLVDVLA